MGLISLVYDEIMNKSIVLHIFAALPVLSKFGHEFEDWGGDTGLVVPDFYCTM